MRINCILHVILSINSSVKFPNFICPQFYICLLLRLTILYGGWGLVIRVENIL